MHPTIEITYPDGQKSVFELTRERTVIGRSSSADVQIKDNRVSREHCAIEIRGDKVYVIDLGGSNGTWVGRTKILSDVPEPFPAEAVVYVGPAQLRLVTGTPDFDPRHDLESQAYVPIAPQPPSRQKPERARTGRPPADTGAGAPPARPADGTQSAALLEPAQRRLSVNPGERASLELAVTNQSKIVDHYTLSVVGVPASWITLPVGGLELLPRQDGSLTIDFHPPRHTRTSAGVHPLSIALLNRLGQVVAQVTAELEIGAFENLVLDIRPNPYQSRSGGALTLTVENHGNAETEYRVNAMDPSDSVDLYVEPQSATVAPQQSRENLIHLRPKKRNWFGEPKRTNITVTVTGNQQSTTITPAYAQLGLVPRWVPILLLMACCVLIPLFGLMAWSNVIGPQLTPTATVPPTAEDTATPTPDIPATMTATREIWMGMDDDGDGLTNGEEVQLGTLPDSKDSDSDGLDDFYEVKRSGTDPTNHDTDGDNVKDGVEENDPCLNPLQRDTDNDTVPDDIDLDSCTGITPTPSPVPDFALGGHVNNSIENAKILRQARMDWIKIQLRYGLGADASSTLQDATQFKQEGFKLLLSVVGSKEELERGDGAYKQAFATFLGQIAPVADGIEVWNEPNIEREWPVGQIDPADYTDMLRLAYNEIKANNPTTLVISAAPAPTGANSDTVMSDDRYIKGMADAGARNYMDCVGIHYNAGATSPGATSGHPADSNSHYSWYYMPMVNLYFDTFNPPGASPQVPLCFTEIGYVSPDGFSQTLSQVGARNFTWAEQISVRDQAEWLEEALILACESGKVKLFIVWNVDFKGYGEDPQGAYAILRPEGDCPACTTLSRAVGKLRNQGCMQ